jgi:hypothetical protein
MYLLSEMHIRVYNARHIKREAAVIFLGRCRRRFACRSRRQKSQASASFAEFQVERKYIILWRQSYPRKIKQFREEGKCIIYLDETWVNVRQTILKECSNRTITTPKDAFLAGLTTGLKHPTARGPRFVIVYAGGKNGFINDAKLVFLRKRTRQTTMMRWTASDLISGSKTNCCLTFDLEA